MKKCPNCNTDLEDNAKFCPSCGQNINTAAPDQTSSSANPAQPNMSAGYGQNGANYNAGTPAYSYQPANPQNGYYGYDTSAQGYNALPTTAEFFGYDFLFGIPMIGFIVELVLAFGSGNECLKRYARAKLIWVAIGAVTAVIIGLIIAAVGVSASGLFNSIFGGYGLRI